MKAEAGEGDGTGIPPSVAISVPQPGDQQDTNSCPTASEEVILGNRDEDVQNRCCRQWRGISENWEENLPFKEGFALSLKGMTVNSYARVY